MIPLQNGSDYYKKMLELQERLRRSEEERIRLEERFSMLEHESRSRHETCINRLRMRYIEFLEEQQARDERNHKLLGALDRVDTSLALMSAKTDRLGALRKQYEASILSSYNNRTNGSMTGDSGVASQTDEKQRRNSCLNSGNKSSRFLSDRGGLAFGENKNTTKKHSFQVRSDRYPNWSGSRYENSQPISSPISSARFSQSTGILNKNSEPLAASNSLNPRRLHNTRSSIDREPVPQTSAYDYRSSSRFVPEYSLRKPESKSYLSDWREGPTATVIRDLANSGAYDSYTIPSRAFNETSGYYPTFQPDRLAAARLASNLSRNDPEKSINVNSSYSNSSKDHSIPGKQKLFTRVTDMLRQELGEEEDYLGSAVENELEQYISKIRNLHREADPQSVEEIDHEQNTSGDLLNVTLSDDGVDLSAEDKPRIRLPQNLENVLEIADDLAKRTATNGRGEKIFEERTATGADGSIDDRNSTSFANQLTSVNPRLGHDEDNEKFSLLAKNGISAEIAKDEAKLETRQRRNIEDVAKIVRNNRDINVGSLNSSGINENKKNSNELNILEEDENQNIEENEELLMEDSLGLKKLEDEYKILVGEVRETEDHLRDIYEEMEPWNLSALERRVQEIILKDEIQDDYIQEVKDQKEQSNVESKNSNAQFETNELNVSTINSTEPMESLPVKTNEDSSPKEKEYETPEILEKSINPLMETHREESREKIEIDNPVDADPMYGVSEENYVQPEENFTQNEYPDNSNPQYEYTSNEQYQADPNEYQNYDPNSVQYEQDPNAQYSYDQQYQAEYNEDPNAQQYPQDQNVQQQFSEDQNLQQYPEDPNLQQYPEDQNLQQYPEDQNLQQYPEDQNLQQYSEDQNLQQYSEDQNLQQYSEDQNLQQYPEDPNAQYENSNALQYENPNEPTEYLGDSPEGYIPTDQEYAADPNQQYATDPNYDGYQVDPNQQYTTNIDPQEYQQNEIYQQQTEDVQYPVSNADYVYPQGQDYANMEVYEPNVQPVTEGQGYYEEAEASYEKDKSSVDEKIKIEANTIEQKNAQKDEKNTKKSKDVIKSILDSDTESTIERNVSNTESDFDFN